MNWKEVTFYALTASVIIAMIFLVHNVSIYAGWHVSDAFKRIYTPAFIGTVFGYIAYQSYKRTYKRN